MSRTLKTLLGLLVGLLILGAWMYVVGVEETLATLRTAAPGPALLSTVAWVVALGLRGWKWHFILLTSQRVPFATSGRVYWASSFLNVIFPFRVGELARSLFLRRLVQVPIATSLPTVLVDRLYSIAVILGSLLFLPLTSFRMDASSEARGALPALGFRWGIGIVAGGFFATLIILYLLRNQKPRLLWLAGRLLTFVPNPARERLLGFLSNLVDGMQFLRSDGRSVLALLGMSLATLLVDALKDHLTLRTFGLYVPVIECFFGVCMTNLAFILPSPPGSIGSNEWYATLIYSVGFGYSRPQVASGALFGHATTLVVASAGALSLSSLGLSFAEGLRISQALPDEIT